MKTKYVIAMVLLLTMVVWIMTGCSTNTSKSDESQSTTETSSSTDATSESYVTASDEAPYEITMLFPTFGTTPADMLLVQDEINKIVLPEINVKVTFSPVSFGTYQDQTNLMLSSGEKVDMLVVLANQFTNFASKGQLLDMTEVLSTYGQDIINNVGMDYIKAGQIGGKQYALTTNRDLASDTIYMMKKEIVDKYNIDVESIHSIADVEKALEIVKANEPDLVPLVPGSVGTSIAQRLFTFDGLGDGIGVLEDFGQNLVVVNYPATEEYASIVNTMRDWYLKGYILEDATTTQEAGPALVKAGRAFSYIATGKPGLIQQETRLSGVEMVGAEIVPAKTSSSTVQGIQWAIPVNCENPEKTMAFLNLMYGNADIANLLSWGIEGKHYVVTENTVINYPEGIDATTTGYGLNMGWMFGNQFLTYTWSGDDPELWTKMKEFNQGAIKSKATGFTYDSSNVKNEVAACTNVQNQYKLGLECGVVDPATVLPEFVKALEDAGIGTIVAEKQAQLDAWAAEQ